MTPKPVRPITEDWVYGGVLWKLINMDSIGVLKWKKIWFSFQILKLPRVVMCTSGYVGACQGSTRFVDERTRSAVAHVFYLIPWWSSKSVTSADLWGVEVVTARDRSDVPGPYSAVLSSLAHLSFIHPSISSHMGCSSALRRRRRNREAAYSINIPVFTMPGWIEPVESPSQGLPGSVDEV